MLKLSNNFYLIKGPKHTQTRRLFMENRDQQKKMIRQYVVVTMIYTIVS
jgi:hypothetical protein